MIHETLMKLRETDDNIRGLKQLIADMQGIRGGTFRVTSSSGFGRPTESRAIKLVDLEEALTSAELDRMCLCQRLEEEKPDARTNWYGNCSGIITIWDTPGRERDADTE